MILIAVGLLIFIYICNYFQLGATCLCRIWKGIWFQWRGRLQWRYLLHEIRASWALL